MASRFGRHQLEWVQRNRTRRPRTKPLGDAISRLAAEVQRRDVEPGFAAAEALAPIVDEEFRSHCMVTASVGRVVTIHVAPDAMVMKMRMRWQRVLADAMTARGGPWRGATIRFVAGAVGVAVPEV